MRALVMAFLCRARRIIFLVRIRALAIACINKCTTRMFWVLSLPCRLHWMAVAS